VAALGFGVAAYAVLETLIVPLLPTIQRELHTSATSISWALTATLMAAAVSTPVLGRIGDLVGKRRVFTVLLGVITVGSIVAAAAPNVPVLLVGRVLQGLGAGILPLAFGLVRDAFPDRVAWAIGVLSSLTSIGTLVGTVFAGPLVDLVGWRTLLLIPLVAVVASGVMVHRFVPDLAERAPGGLNLLAAVLLAVWLVAGLTPLSIAGVYGWVSLPVVASFTLAGVSLVGWVLVEWHAKQPLVDLKMLRLPGVWNTNLAALLLGATMFGVWAYFSRFLQEPHSTGYGLGATAGEAGLVMLPMLIGISIGGLASERISRVIGQQRVLAGSAVVIAFATVAIALFHQTRIEFALEGAVFGFFLGTANAATVSLVVQAVPPSQSGLASGTNVNFRKIGQAIGVTMVTAIVTGSSGSAGQTSEHGYESGFLVLAAIGLCGAPIALAGRRARAVHTGGGEQVLESAAEAI
jgi:MFS family permease